jgi:hypothetical protein
MMVMVDTPIWSLLLRRAPANLNPEQRLVRAEISELIREDRAQIIGPVRQELLSGVRTDDQFQKLRVHLQPFGDIPLTTENYEEAARTSNQCRAAGIAGSSVDFLICAVAMTNGWPVFTTDRDFIAYARHLPLRLHKPR